MPQTTTTAGKNGKKWNPPKTEQAFAEVDLNAKENGIQRHSADDRDDDHDLPGTEDDDRLAEEAPRERKFLDRTKTVQKRITRLERTFSQRFAEMQAENQRQIAKLKNENKQLRLNRGNGDADEAAHNAKIAQLTSQLEEAIEKGETKTQARLSVEISQLQGAYESAKRAALLGKKDDEDEEEEAPRTVNSTPGPTREARKWMRSNEGWWGDDRYAVEKAAAIAIDNQLIEEGSDPNDPEHYEDLVSRLVEKFPDMEDEVVLADERRSRRARDDQDDDEDEEDRGSRRDSRDRDRRGKTPPVMGFNQRGGERGNQPVRKGRTVTLTREQRQNMVTFGLDPENDDHVKEYAKSAEETNRSYSREGR